MQYPPSTRYGQARRAVTGVLIALLVFGAVFIAGVGYYLFQAQSALQAEQAAQSKEGGLQGALSENLLVMTSLAKNGHYANWLTVDAYNSGGVTTTITAIFVTTLNGKALSASTQSPYSEFLIGTPDLNVTLPISLAPGEGTGSLQGCGAASCHIGINPLSCKNCLTSGTIYINVVTSRGNTFSAPYPSQVTATTSTVSHVSTLSSTSTSTAVISSSISTVSVTSSTNQAGFQAGTNSILLSMRACAGSGTTCTNAPVIYSGQEVLLEINVTNFANVNMQVYVNYQQVGTNGASVINPSCSGGQTSTQTIPADTGTATMVQYFCTFTASQGPTGGTVSFIGYAVGSYQVVPAPPVQVSSAEVMSNPVDLGNFLSAVTGPLIPISFNYASAEQATFGSATIISAGSNKEVIFQGTFENTANASVTILEYSFLLVARISQEENYYVITPASSWTSSISGYTCTAGGTGNAPAGSSCSTAQTNCTVLGNGCVPTGSQITLDFAACAAAGTSWMWSQFNSGNSACSDNSSGLNAPEAVTMFAIVIYDYYSGGSWHVLAQAVPIQGTYFTS